jgi:GT2 family glycosyltransferase
LPKHSSHVEISAMTRIAVAVVLYKTDPNASSTLISLVSQTFRQFKVFLWDNSPQPLSLSDIQDLSTRFVDLTYESTPENLGLAHIYNELLTKSADDYDLLIVFDQDSSFDKEYIATLARDYEQNKTFPAYIPIVYSQQTYHAPRRDIPIVARFWKASGGRSYSAGARLNSINSGNALNIRVLQNLGFRFDENLRFYGIDNFLFRSLYRGGLGVFVSNARLDQSLATLDVSTDDDLYARYQAVIIAYKKVYFPTRFNLWKAFGALRILKIALSRRDPQYLRLLSLL